MNVIWTIAHSQAINLTIFIKKKSNIPSIIFQVPQKCSFPHSKYSATAIFWGEKIYIFNNLKCSDAYITIKYTKSLVWLT